MLAADRLPKIIESNLADGIEGIVLITDSGNLLSSAVMKSSVVNETVLAAVSSAVWANCCQGNSTPPLQMHICKLENGYLAISPAGKDYLVAAFGTTVECGLLRSRVEKLSQYFSEVFEQLK